MENKHEPSIVKVILLITPAFTSLMDGSLRAVLEGFVAVSDFVEEMYLILPGKKRYGDAVYRSISPALSSG